MHFDVIIVGGGLAGLSLARALRDTRLSVALVENRPPVRPAGWDARVYALTPANAAFLADLGAWYLVILGVVAIVITLFLLCGLWGPLSGNGRIRLFPVGYRLHPSLAALTGKSDASDAIH